MYIPNYYINSKEKTKIKYRKHLKNMSILLLSIYIFIMY